MSKQNFSEVFVALHTDLGRIESLWTVLTLTAVLALSWWISRHVRTPKFLQAEPFWRSILDFGEGGLKRIAFPLVGVILLSVARKTVASFGWPLLGLYDLVSPLLLAWLLARVLVYLLRSVFHSGGFLNAFERLITATVWIIIALDMTGLSVPLIEILEQFYIVVGKQRLDLWMLLRGTVTIAATLLIALWIASLIERRLMAATSLDANLREVLARVAKALLSLVALLLSLSLVGIDITALSVFSGAFAVGLGFGLQKIASNYVSGFIILLDRSIQLGSLVAIDDKTTGTVTTITTRYTVLRTLGGAELIIPNEYLISNIVRNLSYTDRRVSVTLTVQVGSGTDIDTLIPQMVEIAKRHPRVLADPGPWAIVTQLADNGVQLDMGVWVSDPEKGTGGIRSDIYLGLLKYFREQGIEVPFPQREVRLLNDALKAEAVEKENALPKKGTP